MLLVFVCEAVFKTLMMLVLHRSALTALAEVLFMVCWHIWLLCLLKDRALLSLCCTPSTGDR